MNNRWSRLGGVLGIVYCVVGVLLIFLGWNGAASNDRVQAQLPYVVSGGIGGLALVIVGAALMVAHSLRTDRVELRGGIDDLRRSIDRIGSGAPLSTAAAPALTGVSSTAVLAGPTSYHRPACSVVQGHADATPMTVGEARASGRTPCRICTPDEPTLTVAS
jgi:drug/metabolite transporter (DMT)-like permease